MTEEGGWRLADSAMICGGAWHFGAPCHGLVVSESLSSGVLGWPMCPSSSPSTARRGIRSRP